MPQLRTEKLQVTATKGQKREIQRRARRLGLTSSTYLLRCGLAEDITVDRNGAVVTQPESPKSPREQSIGADACKEARQNVVGLPGPSIEQRGSDE